MCDNEVGVKSLFFAWIYSLASIQYGIVFVTKWISLYMWVFPYFILFHCLFLCQHPHYLNYCSFIVSPNKSIAFFFFFLISSHLCIPVAKHNRSRCIFLFVYIWSQFARVLFSIFMFFVWEMKLYFYCYWILVSNLCWYHRKSWEVFSLTSIRKSMVLRLKLLSHI